MSKIKTCEEKSEKKRNLMWFFSELVHHLTILALKKEFKRNPEKNASILEKYKHEFKSVQPLTVFAALHPGQLAMELKRAI